MTKPSSTKLLNLSYIHFGVLSFKNSIFTCAETIMLENSFFNKSILSTTKKEDKQSVS